jgi:nucleoside-diphosphate kinase
VFTAINNKGLRFGSVVFQPEANTFYFSCKGPSAAEVIKNLEQVYPFLQKVADPQPSTFKLAPRSTTPKNTTICVVKPHVILSGDGGAIVQKIIDDGFEIVSFMSINLGQCDAEDFFEVYKGVVPEYAKLVEHVASGPSWAIELRCADSVAAFRALCGPHDPEICKVLFPTSIRAQYGIDRAKNAVHCTDLPEESVLESEFFFTLMAGKP